MAAVKLTSLSYLGLAVETAQGTPVAPTAFIPLRGFKPQDEPKYIADTGYRGQPVDTFGEYAGPQSATWDLDGDFFPTSGGNLLASIFGTDTVSGSSAPYTHTFTVAGTPGSWTLSDYYVAGYRQWPGTKLDKLSLKFTPEAGLSYTATAIGWPSATGTAPTSITFGTSPFFLGWEAALTLNSVSTAPLTDATLTIERKKSAPQFAANNSQNPYDIFVGPMEVTWELGFFMTDDTQYKLALSQQSIPVSIEFTQPNTNDTLTLTSTTVQWTKPTIDRSGDMVKVNLTGTAVYNATDSGVLQAALANSIQTAYTTTAAS